MSKSIQTIFSLILFLFSVTAVFADNIVDITPSNPNTLNDLSCDVRGNYNPDGYVWEVTGTNGVSNEVSDLKGKFVPASRTVHFQDWTCKILVNFGNGVIQQIGKHTVTIANTAPVISAVTVPTGIVGYAYSLNIDATDVDNDNLVYSLDAASIARGMTIDSETGVISWTPAVAGTFSVVVSVTDGHATATRTYSITIRDTLTVTATATPDSGNEPLTVAFSAIVTGGSAPYSYAWDFENDGSFDSVAPSPSHTYSNDGTYTARVQITDGLNAIGTALVTVTVNPAGTFSVDVNANPTSGEAPLTVQFTSTVVGGTGLTYAWTFDDGSTSTSANPSHVFSSAGTYDVSLTVTDSLSRTATDGETITVTSPGALVVSIVANPNSGYNPLTVAFTSTVVGGNGINTYAWNFGDGSTSTSANPSHTYSAAGTYDVSLTVTDSASHTGSVVENDFVSVYVPGTLILETSADPQSGTAPLSGSVDITNLLGTAPYDIEWYLDGTLVSGFSGMTYNYVFALPGTHDITVMVEDNAGLNAQSSEIITVTAPVPTITVSSCGDGREDHSYTCDINANGLGTLRYSLDSHPTNMSINSNTGLISWTPTNHGTFTFTVRVTDTTYGVSATRTYTIDVASSTSDNNGDLNVEVTLDNDDYFPGEIVEASVNVENDGNEDVDDLKITMEIAELGLKQTSSSFDLNDGDDKTKTIELQLPSSMSAGSYTVKFTVKNDDVKVTETKQVQVIKSTSTTRSSTSSGNAGNNKAVNVVSQPSISSYQPTTGQKARLNWKGIWFMILLLLLLLAIAIYLIKRLREQKQEQESQVSVEAIDGFY